MTLTRRTLASFCLLCTGALFSGASQATSSFVNNQLLVPYVTAGSQIHGVTLDLVPGTDPPTFELGPYSTYPAGTIAPEGSAEFSDNILSLPSIAVGASIYEAKLRLLGSLLELTEAAIVSDPGSGNSGEQSSYVANLLDGQLFNQILTNRDPDCRSYVGDYSASGMEDTSNFLSTAPFFPGTDVTSEVQIDLVIVGGEYDNLVAWDYDSVTPTTNVDSATHCRLTSNMIPNHDFGWEVGSPSLDDVWVTEIDHDDDQVTYIPVNPQMPANLTAQDTPRDPTNYMDLDGILLNGVGIAMDSGFCFNPSHSRVNVAGNATGCGGLSVWYELPAYTIFDSDADNMAAIFDNYFGHGFEGTYHYHAVTHPLQADDDQSVGPAGGSPLIGFARDGFPIYGHWLIDDAGELVKAQSGYILKTYELNDGNSRDPYVGLPTNFDRGTPPTPWDISNRPNDFDTGFGLPFGRYEDDWVFDSTGDTGNLDMCNGATDAQGNYGYYLTDKYPFTPPCVFGIVEASFGKVPPLRHGDENYNDAIEQATNGH